MKVTSEDVTVKQRRMSQFTWKNRGNFHEGLYLHIAFRKETEKIARVHITLSKCKGIITTFLKTLSKMFVRESMYALPTIILASWSISLAHVEVHTC